MPAVKINHSSADQAYFEGRIAHFHSHFRQIREDVSVIVAASGGVFNVFVEVTCRPFCVPIMIRKSFRQNIRKIPIDIIRQM